MLSLPCPICDPITAILDLQQQTPAKVSLFLHLQKPAPNWWKRYTICHFQEFHHVNDGVQIEAQFWKALASTEDSPRAPFHHVTDGVQIEAQFWKALESAENSPTLSLSLATLNPKAHEPSTDLHCIYPHVLLFVCLLSLHPWFELWRTWNIPKFLINAFGRYASLLLQNLWP